MPSRIGAAIRAFRQALTQSPQAPAQNRMRGQMATRQYSSARSSRLTAGWQVTTSSADTELASSLTLLRNRSRSLIRDTSYAKRAKMIVVNNVIGTGIGMQAQVMTSRGVLNERVNADIEEAWCEWSEADSCHTGGRLAFKHLERAAMGQVFEAGECFIRKHRRKFGKSKVPYALELIEAERLADDVHASIASQTGNEIRMGVEVDEFYRPVAYWFRKRHPGEIRFTANTVNQIERVPAEDIIHLAFIDRWPQTRGEPWLHCALRRFNDMDGYSEAEIIRARAQASLAGGIETPEDSTSFGEEMDDGSVEMEMEPGVLKRTNPGEKIILPSPTAPNASFDAFMRSMLREVAAGSGPSYESLSRDYSQSNFSSSRLALLDDRDLWRFCQSWFCCDFRCIVHEEWLEAAVLAGAIPSIAVQDYALNPEKFEAVLFKPRGWSWIDPATEVAAYKEAVRCGFTTVSDVVAKTGEGRDIEDVINERRRELDLMKEKNLTFETDPQEFNDKGQAQPLPPDPGGADNVSASQATQQQQTQNPPKKRVFSLHG